MRIAAGVVLLALLSGCVENGEPPVTPRQDSTVTRLPPQADFQPLLDPGEWLFSLADSLGGGVEDLVARLERPDSTGWSQNIGELEARARRALEDLQLRRDEFEPSDVSTIGNYCTFVLGILESITDHQAAVTLDRRMLRERLDEERNMIEPLIARYSPLF